MHILQDLILDSCVDFSWDVPQEDPPSHLSEVSHTVMSIKYDHCIHYRTLCREQDQHIQLKRLHQG